MYHSCIIATVCYPIRVIRGGDWGGGVWKPQNRSKFFAKTVKPLDISWKIGKTYEKFRKTENNAKLNFSVISWIDFQ